MEFKRPERDLMFDVSGIPGGFYKEPDQIISRPILSETPAQTLERKTREQLQADAAKQIVSDAHGGLTPVMYASRRIGPGEYVDSRGRPLAHEFIVD